MSLVDIVKHALPMKLADGKRHVWPTLASMVTRNDGSTLEQDGKLTADNAMLLGGKAPEYYIQPRNLLDNSDFEIAQAGYGEMYGTTKFAADRWECHVGLVVSKVSNGLEISSTREYDGMWQYLGIDAAKYSGKRITAAMSVNGDVFAVTSTMGANQVNVVGNGATLILALAGTSPYVQVNISRVAAVINWVALYEGEYTAETLPPYVPKGYAAELLACEVAENGAPLCEGDALTLEEIAASTNLDKKVASASALSDVYNSNSIDLNAKTYTSQAEIYDYVLSQVPNGRSAFVVLNGENVKILTSGARDMAMFGMINIQNNFLINYALFSVIQKCVYIARQNETKAVISSTEIT